MTTPNTSTTTTTTALELKDLEDYRIKSLPPSAYYISSFITPQEASTLLTNISKNPWTTLTHRRLQPHPAPLTPSGHLLTTKSLPEFLVSPIVDRILSLSFSSDNNNKSKNNNNNNNNNDDNENREEDDDDNDEEGKERKEKEKRGIFTTSPHTRPNHVLINEYPPNTGIAAHEDGAAYFPVVCTVSLGSHILLEVTPKPPPPSSSSSSQSQSPQERREREEGGVGEEGNQTKYRIFQEPNSLLITTDEMYTNHLHGILAVEADEGLDELTVANWGLLGDGTRRGIVESGGVVRREGVRISLTYRDVLKVKDAGRLFGGRGVAGRR
ncbi:hypothetical protein TWF730_003798 [Orbilia blumenaviensis]|uniref:Fe2OG dioxygenase domain-containing protein n=1 Tax=Orbilia blumenaviensis TaxID=1796055 RepID=A0AAV9U111_9PEZI